MVSIKDRITEVLTEAHRPAQRAGPARLPVRIVHHVGIREAIGRRKGRAHGKPVPAGAADDARALSPARRGRRGHRAFRACHVAAGACLGGAVGARRRRRRVRGRGCRAGRPGRHRCGARLRRRNGRALVRQAAIRRPAEPSSSTAACPIRRHLERKLINRHCEQFPKP